MSTNFYFHPDTEGPLQQFSSIHIGLRAGGWTFMFQGFRPLNGNEGGDLNVEALSDDVRDLNVRSWKDWQALLSTYKGTIVNEYGDELTVPEFVETVTAISPGKTWGPTGRPLKDHINEWRKSRAFAGDDPLDWHDAEGFSFTSREFS